MNDIQRIRGDYLPSADIFRDERPKVDKSKQAVAKLTPTDQAIFICYCEDRSLQKVADRFKVSKAYIHKIISRIRKEIKSNL